jgi:hypothetical protein
VWDGENRLLDASGVAFVYAPDGKRLKKVSGANTTLYGAPAAFPAPPPPALSTSKRYIGERYDTETGPTPRSAARGEHPARGCRFSIGSSLLFT